MSTKTLVKEERQKNNFFASLWENIKSHPELYIMIFPYIIWVIIFQYGPMYGILVAFKDFVPALGVTRSPWTAMNGFKNFYDFLTLPTAGMLVRNTLRISFWNLVVSFPLPILLSIGYNHLTRRNTKRVYQTISYAPNFISTVVVIGIMDILLNGQVGVLNQIIESFGGQSIDFMNSTEWFVPVYVLSGVWKGIGWGTIIYTGALTGINPELYEATKIDGASKWQQIRYIEWPALKPLVSISLILSVGGLMSVGWEKAYLLQSPLNLSVSQIISTYTYQMGIVSQQYEYSAAIGLLNTIVNIILLLVANTIAKTTSGDSLF